MRKFRFVKNTFLISERNFCTCCLSVSLKSRYFTFRRMFIIIIRTRGGFFRICDSTKKNPQNFKNFRSLEKYSISRLIIFRGFFCVALNTTSKSLISGIEDPQKIQSHETITFWQKLLRDRSKRSIRPFLIWDFFGNRKFLD